MGQLSVDLSAKMEVLKTKTQAQQNRDFVSPLLYARLEPARPPTTRCSGRPAPPPSATTKARVIFEQRDVEVPSDWSQTATNIVASKYFYGKLGSPERETSVAQLVERVVDTIAGLGQKGRLLRDRTGRREFPQRTGAPDADAEGVLQLAGLVQRRGERDPRIRLDLSTRHADQVTKLESGVLRPQCSACFIVSVKDSLESILDLAKTEGMLFKWGSGTGTNLSALA